MLCDRLHVWFIPILVDSYAFIFKCTTVCRVSNYVESQTIPASILRKSTSGRHRPVSYPDGPMTARYRFTQNADWDDGAYLYFSLEGDV